VDISLLSALNSYLEVAVANKFCCGDAWPPYFFNFHTHERDACLLLLGILTTIHFQETLDTA
jgi:hypothetical protein